MIKKTFLILFAILISSSSLFAQTEQQIKDKLKSQGITSSSQIKAELQRRNMTENDARKLAEKYGISYDQFIASYIVGGTDLNTPPKKTTTIKPIIPPPPPNPPKKTVKKAITKTVKKSGGLTYFGYNLFKNIPQSFKPTEIGPIDPGYIIGPGDVLQLYIWGAVELQYQLTVDIQGNIFIPTAGQFFVSGIAYKDLQKKLINYLSKFYQGLKTNPPKVFLDITLAKLRPIRIFVLGEVAQPGGYNISSYATVFNALYSVGGPLTSGSLREIRVIRNNKVITKVDLYDYLLKGKLIGDVRLQNNDMIFIPPRGKTVTIKGEVLRPAIYELKGNENLQK
ncbi:MAG TPA: polysaccharide export protein, partial [Ignavibacteria bacterium]|nr:polysaccharide export protein [Ignavibacteria bacterium]